MGNVLHRKLWENDQMVNSMIFDFIPIIDIHIKIQWNRINPIKSYIKSH